MKWGVRRTPAQLARARGKLKSEKEESDDSSKSTSSSSSKKKSVSEMSESELRDKINRLELEKRYTSLMKEVNPPKSNKGKEFATRVIEKIGENALVNLGTQAANHVLGNMINKVAGVKSDDVVRRIVNPQKGQTDKK